MSKPFHTDATDEAPWFHDLAQHITAELKETGELPRHMPMDRPAVTDADSLLAAAPQQWRFKAAAAKGQEGVLYPARRPASAGVRGWETLRPHTRWPPPG